MAVAWNDRRRADVSDVLARYHVDSGECELAAQAIVPIAQQQDPHAQMWQLVPTEGRYVVPRLDHEVFWFHHFTVEVDAHCVDALTGVDGTSYRSYLDRHWLYGDAIAWQPCQGASL